MAGNLAPVYLDENRIVLQGDPRPKVSKILLAGGMDPEATVLRLRSPDDADGERLRPEDVIDRTAASAGGVFLRCIDPEDPRSASLPGGGKRPRPALRPPGPVGRSGQPGSSEVRSPVMDPSGDP